MSQDHNKVLFIAGPGRSGSTLLDMLLGQMDGFCSTGEMRFIWQRGFAQNQLCGCGKPFRECEFWTAVADQAFGGFHNVDHKRLEELRYSLQNRISNGISFNPTPEVMAPYREYLDAYRKLYRSIQNVSGCDVIVDSSKHVAHGFVLGSIPEIDLYITHLMRDSRAVAYSWQRKKVRPEIHWKQEFMTRRGVLKSAARWNLRNILVHRLQRSSKAYAFLRYEDLANHPKESLEALLSELGLETPALDFLAGSHANLKPSHTVSGNPVRFERREIEIRPDTQWQKAMAKHQMWLVTLLTWPLLLKYGYL